MSLTFCSSINVLVKGLHVESFPTINSFPYYMVSVIPGFPLHFLIRVSCLVRVKHTLKSGY